MGLPSPAYVSVYIDFVENTELNDDYRFRSSCERRRVAFMGLPFLSYVSVYI